MVCESWNNKIISHPCFPTTWISILISAKAYLILVQDDEKVYFFSKEIKRQKTTLKFLISRAEGVGTHISRFDKSDTVTLGLKLWDVHNHRGREGKIIVTQNYRTSWTQTIVAWTQTIIPCGQAQQDRTERQHVDMPNTIGHGVTTWTSLTW